MDNTISFTVKRRTKCERCRFAANPYKDPFTGRTEYGCSIAEPIVDNFGDSVAITSNMVTDCKGFESKEKASGFAEPLPMGGRIPKEKDRQYHYST